MVRARNITRPVWYKVNLGVSDLTEAFEMLWICQMFRARQEPVYPEYGDVYNRLRSFAGRPVPAGQTADALANAGFFYIGEVTYIVWNIQYM